MQLIKLDAIDSTNEFLKGLSSNQLLENFTVVTAENQTKGKGQMGAVWNSEPVPDRLGPAPDRCRRRGLRERFWFGMP